MDTVLLYSSTPESPLTLRARSCFTSRLPFDLSGCFHIPYVGSFICIKYRSTIVLCSDGSVVGCLVGCVDRRPLLDTAQALTSLTHALKLNSLPVSTSMDVISTRQPCIYRASQACYPHHHVMGAYVTCETNSMTYGHMISVVD